MKKLYTFILKSFLGPLAFTFFICMFILILQTLWKYVDELVGKGLDWTVIVEFMLYVSATLIPMALPLSILLASLMTFGNLGEKYELIAIKSAGVSLPKVMRPLFGVIILICISAFLFANYVMPVATLKSYNLRNHVRKKAPEMMLTPGFFTNDLEGYSIKVGSIGKKDALLKDIMIYDHSKGSANKNLIIAKTGRFNFLPNNQGMLVTLWDGYQFKNEKNDRKKNNYPFTRISFGEQKMIISLPDNDVERSDNDFYKQASRAMNMNQLAHFRDSLTEKLSKTTKMFVKKHSTYRYQKSLKKDSINFNSNIEVDLDSLFKAQSISRKYLIINSAANYCKNIKYEIQSKKKKKKRVNKRINKFKNQWHGKLALPFACLIFFFIGAPLGSIIRKGGLGMPVVISIVFFIIYFIINSTFERLSREGVVTPFIGMWTSSLVMLPLGIVLTYKATTDSALFNLELYIDFFKKIKRIFKKNRSKISD